MACLLLYMGMILAVSVWNERIAPVFDCSGRALLYELEDGALRGTGALSLAGVAAADRGRALRERGVDELLCGAVSRPVEQALRAEGIGVRGFLAGDVPTVLQARLQGALDREEFYMPGCGSACGKRRRRRGRCRGNPADGDEE